MHSRFIIRVAATLSAMVLQVTPVRSGDPKENVSSKESPPRQQARTTVERSLAFLEKDAVAWRRQHRCATCHHGALTVWALSEAKKQHYTVAEETLAEMRNWTKAGFVPAADQRPNRRPGDNVPDLAAVYLTLSTWAEPVGVTHDEIGRIAKHISDRQESDGAWPLPPPRIAAPPVFESRETMTIWFYLALERDVPGDPKQPSSARESRTKAAKWLNETKPGDTTQTAALRLLIDVRKGKSAKPLQAGIDRLLSRQKADGGWGQSKDLPSDAYATGQALYVLSLAGVKDDRPEIRRAVGFLVANQNEDGSWPMTPRATSERAASRTSVPIVYFGSAWATLGLIRSLPQ